MEQYEFHEYRMQFNALFHSIAATGISIYCLWFTCPNQATYFNSTECRENVRNSQVWATMFTAGYLTVETAFIFCYCGVKTSIDKQTLVHHIIVAFNIYVGYWQ